MKSTVLFASLIVAALGCKDESAATKPATQASRIAINVTEDGFSPEHVTVPQGKAVTLVFDRKTDDTCAKQIVLEVAGRKIEKDLPLNHPVEVEVTFPEAGELTYACGMDMVRGTITVQ